MGPNSNTTRRMGMLVPREGETAPAQFAEVDGGKLPRAGATVTETGVRPRAQGSCKLGLQVPPLLNRGNTHLRC